MEEAACPVPCVLKDGAVWAEGSLALANLLGLIPAFRRWAEPDPGIREVCVLDFPESQPVVPAVPAAPAAGGSGSGGGGPFLAGYRGHLIAVVSHKTVCWACFQVAGGGQL